ncbi:MAG: c-type cytochrome [Gammaproteobacteria bacterium]
MMKKRVALVVVGVLAGAHGLAQAGDAAAGKAKAMVCAACHGANGISTNPMYPNLAGQKEQYIVKQLKDFQAGARINPLMSSMAKSLTPADIENVATYFSSLK